MPQHEEALRRAEEVRLVLADLSAELRAEEGESRVSRRRRAATRALGIVQGDCGSDEARVRVGKLLRWVRGEESGPRVDRDLERNDLAFVFDLPVAKLSPHRRERLVGLLQELAA